MLAHYIRHQLNDQLQDMIQDAVINSMDEDRHNITLQALEIKDQRQRDNWYMKTIQATAIAYGKRCKQMAGDLKDFILQIFPPTNASTSPSNHRPHQKCHQIIVDNIAPDLFFEINDQPTKKQHPNTAGTRRKEKYPLQYVAAVPGKSYR